MISCAVYSNGSETVSLINEHQDNKIGKVTTNTRSIRGLFKKFSECAYNLRDSRMMTGVALVDCVNAVVLLHSVLTCFILE
jgi:hypothetical protein